METHVDPAWDPGPGRPADGGWLDWLSRGWLVFIVVCVVASVGLGVAWLRWRPVEHESWGLVAVDGAALTVWVTGCIHGSGPFVHATERPKVVDVEVTVHDAHALFGAGGCRTFGERLVISLKQPLGDRRLSGCREPDCRALVMPEGL